MKYYDLLKFGSEHLKSKNISSYNLDSELLLAKLLNSSREQILINLNNEVDDKFLIPYKKLIFRRKKNEPVAYLIKKKEFWKFNFLVNKDVLIPRPETEILVDQSLKLINSKKSCTILDVGTGSGCIIISILKERPNCRATAIDISRKAIKIAKFNAKMHHIENKIKFLNINIDKFLFNKYDFIVSNPPYIKKFNIKRLEDNVKNFEPYLALEAGIDGFREIYKLILKSKLILKRNGKLIFEIGENQEQYSKVLLKNNGFYINKICKDIQFKSRAIVSTKII